MDYSKFTQAKEIESKIKFLMREKNDITEQQKRIFQQEIGYGMPETGNKELFNKTYEKVIEIIDKTFGDKIAELEKEFENI